MCYHTSQDFEYSDLIDYYRSARFAKAVEEMSSIRHYHVNGFDHLPSPVFKSDGEVGVANWGLIPWWTKSMTDALQIRTRTLNCISEEGYEKPSFRDSLNNGQRCLIPVTGFFEWRWGDKAGKKKYPYYVFLKDQKIFSLAGIYSRWVDKQTGEEVISFCVLTSKANPLMEKIHNNKKRMPVIIDRQFESDWLSDGLTKEDVLAFCQPYDQGKMDGYTISKLITSRKEETDQPKVLEKAEYPELLLMDS
ncbi:MAG: SOS response-associated peptidase [Cyclobacteriaceae bacterium]|nr:SOS response-associated peptidase [Cyclobacteriaceae bacterium]